MMRHSDALRLPAAVIAVAVGCALPSAPVEAQDFCFKEAVTYAVGAYPYSVFAADLDGDGDADLAVANWDNVSMLLSCAEVGHDAVFEPQSMALPSTFALQQNIPNPFNASIIIRFSLITGGPAELGIYNILGRCVSVHRELDLPPGSYSYQWDGTDDAGRQVPSGVYLYRLTTQRFTQARKMTLLK